MKAEDILVLDVRKLTQITDFFVLASTASERQLKAIAERLHRELKAAGAHCLGVEGEAAGGWVLLDYVDVVVHLFSREARDFYALEMLWGDAPRVRWQA
ncbi:MAG: ribosome silencing factor [Planctomycetes bacterium]|nr:ribosome silencing factor [Planctomycetota bacterium]